MKGWRIALGCAGALVLGLIGRKIWHAYPTEPSRGQQLLVTHHVDLAQTPAAPPPPQAAPLPPVRTKPMLVDIVFIDGRAKKRRAYRGLYQIIDNNGVPFTDGTAPESGEPVELLLSPGRYTVKARGSTVANFDLRYHTQDDLRLKVVVP